MFNNILLCKYDIYFKGGCNMKKSNVLLSETDLKKIVGGKRPMKKMAAFVGYNRILHNVLHHYFGW